MNRLTPLAKGLITAAAMIALTLVIHYTQQNPDTGIIFLLYLLYAGGIAWTLIEYVLFINPSAKFGELFGQGFRCFMVVTLAMVLFTGLFSVAHPEFAEQDSKLYREYLEKEVKDKTPAEKDEMAAAEKKQYTTKLVFSSIFGHLILGCVFNAAGSAIILLRRK